MNPSIRYINNVGQFKMTLVDHVTQLGQRDGWLAGWLADWTTGVCNCLPDPYGRFIIDELTICGIFGGRAGLLFGALVKKCRPWLASATRSLLSSCQERFDIKWHPSSFELLAYSLLSSGYF